MSVTGILRLHEWVYYNAVVCELPVSHVYRMLMLRSDKFLYLAGYVQPGEVLVILP